VVANGMILKEAKIVNGMTEDLFVCAEDDNIEEAARLSVRNEIRHLLDHNPVYLY
jgi:CBS domain-containing protein